LAISPKVIFNARRSLGERSAFSFLAKILSKNTGISVPVKNVTTRGGEALAEGGVELGVFVRQEDG
jgi:hypothetical protein